MRRPANVERVRYWDGQQLRSGDLRTQRTTDEELRWWHNRAVHGAYGVVHGLGVKPTASGYRVEPGLAYDGYGRELLVPCPVNVPPPCTVEVPTPPGFVWWTLLLGYDGGAHRVACTRDDLDGACLPAGRCAGNDGVGLFWVPRRIETDCAGVPLASYTYDGNGYTEDPDFIAPDVRPLAQPRIVTGQTPAGYTGWEEWFETDSTGNQQLLGFQLPVDTSAAGFATPPCYFAWLDAPRVWQSVATTGSPVVNVHWRIPFDWIVDESPAGFTMRVPVLDELLASKDIRTLRNFLIFVRCYDISVCWVGIEEPCTPPYEWCQECCE